MIDFDEMDYEKAYKEMMQRAKELHEVGNALTKQQMEIVCPELAESEDERIRKLLVWQVYRNIEDETNDLAQSVYDGIKGHDPDLEESIEDWKKCLAYLEKQKEQKVDVDKLRRDIYQSGYNDGYQHGKEDAQKEQKPAEWSEEDEFNLKSCIGKIEIDMQHWGKHGKTMVDGDIRLIDWLKSLPERFEIQPKQEWSEEDRDMIESIEMWLHEIEPKWVEKELAWLRSLRPQPQWKPSEEQMNALKYFIKLWGKTDTQLEYTKVFNNVKSLYEQLKKLMEE